MNLLSVWLVGLINIFFKLLATIWLIKVDEANVDTSISVESCNWWIQALEAWVVWNLWMKTQEIEIIEIGVEEEVDLGSGMKGSLFPNLVL